MKNRKSVHICLCAAVLPEDRQAVTTGMFKGMDCKEGATNLAFLHLLLLNLPTCTEVTEVISDSVRSSPSVLPYKNMTRATELNCSFLAGHVTEVTYLWSSYINQGRLIVKYKYTI